MRQLPTNPILVAPAWHTLTGVYQQD